MWVTFHALLVGALRDRISLLYALAFPLIALVLLGLFFKEPGYQGQLLIGLVALGGFFFSTTGTGFEVMRQRRQGVYKLLRATPFPITSFVTSLTAARGLIALACALVVFLGGSLYLGSNLQLTSLLLMLPVLLLGTLCFTAMGFILGNLGNNETQVAGINNLFTLPIIFGSPIFYSLENAPQWVHLLSKAMPMSHYIAALQAAQAGSLSALLLPLAALLGFTLAILLVAVLTFRWDPDVRYFRSRAA